MAILAANVIFGLNIPVTKSLMAQWMTPQGYTITRILFGAVIFWVIASFFQREKVKRKDLLPLFLGGLVGFLATQLFFAQSLTYTSPVIFSLLMALIPVVVLLLARVFLQERVARRKILGIILSIAGAAIIILQGDSEDMSGRNHFLGITFALLCVCAYSSYLIITRKVSLTYQPLTLAKWMFLFSALLVLPFCFSGLAGQKIYSEDTSLEAISLLAFAILFSSTLAFFLMPLALKRLEASTVSIFMNLQPLVASGVAIGIGQDSMSWEKAIAGLLVLGGVYLVSR